MKTTTTIFILLLSCTSLWAEIVTPSFSSSEHTVNPAATALRNESVYSAEYIYDNYELTQPDLTSNDVSWPTAKNISVKSGKFKNIWAQKFFIFTPEIFASFDSGTVSESNYIYPARQSAGSGNSYEGKASSIHSHINLGVQVFPGLYIGVRQFYAQLKAEYELTYSFDGGSGNQKGKAKNNIKGQSAGVTIGLFDTIFVGGTYFKSHKQYNTTTTMTDTTSEPVSTQVDTSKVKVVQYAVGGTIMLGSKKGNKGRLEIYKLTQKKRSIFSDMPDLEDGSLEKITAEMELGIISLGAKVQRHKGDYLNIYRLSDYYFFNLTPTNDYVYNYGVNLGLKPTKGFSLGLSALYSKGEMKEAVVWADSPVTYDIKQIKHISAGVNISYTF